VLADLDGLEISTVVNLGDVFYGPLDPRGSADLILKRSIPTVCGNEDRIIFDSASPKSETLSFVRAQLNSRHLEWLESLTMCISVGPAIAFHASPRSDAEYLLWDIRKAGAFERRPGEIRRILGDIESRLVLCGHDHVPRTRALEDGSTVVNPGSVGLPAYCDDVPHPHVMETGSPHAHYSVVSETSFGFLVADRAVPYDWESAAEVAQSNGRPDWALWLRTGQATIAK
jgi:diadenosine tetraphosphatase ApaH/serine/threonine PP2A family protein phosphatase